MYFNEKQKKNQKNQYKKYCNRVYAKEQLLIKLL